ncbi:hypothetical protein [Cylindrospermopsis raciborskii]|uniref:Uncharacterized protein n=2 Tax=Cylindrospermopsis raciborskii TaxID=77022 RepID=A0A9Q5QZG6_9CYAN|nr:hypothetical protein [Cylindrospermopsis raciborskii]OHY31706.1 hypothetical protein BCV64_14430 [Cylindrospermopsis raciborskii MVCC14]OPH10939.1 hypothetical protein CENA302_02225 [Cylindrospermopsis raciborskii CENA302]
MFIHSDVYQQFGCYDTRYKVAMDYEFILLVSGFVDTYLDLSPLEEIEFEEEIRKFSQPIQEGVMQITTSWMRQGLEQGIEQGTNITLTL